MKKYILFVFVILFTKNLVALDVILKVNITDNKSGVIYLSLCDKDGFMSKEKYKDCAYNIVKKLEDGKQEYTFTINDIKGGDWTVMGFIDTDDNQKLNTNMLSIPTEPTLLTVKLSSIPTWNKLKINISKNNQIINLINN